MGSGIYFPISAIPFCILLIVLCFSKKTVITNETKIYKYLVITNFIGLILELLCTYASIISTSMPVLSDIILKSYLVYNIVWTFILTAYVYYVSKINNDKIVSKHIKTISAIVLPISVIITYILKCNLVVSPDFTVRYTNGPSVIFTYSICGLFIALMIIFMSSNIHNLKNKKYIPIYVFLVTIILGIAIQIKFPGLLIMTFIETLTLAIMYFTIENPDVRFIEELSRNKKLLEDTLQDKSNFLFRMSNEITQPIKNIEMITKKISDEKNKKLIEEGIHNIAYETKNINSIINDILDTSNINEDNIKKYKDKYSIKRIYDEISIKIGKKIENKNIKFTSNISENVPNYLYGDFIKLKQIIYNLLNDSIKNKTNYINMSIDSIIKNNVCRLIITIEDTVTNLDAYKINDILAIKTKINKEDLDQLEKENANLQTIYKTIKYLGGSLIIKSNDNGREFIISIDELIFKEKTNQPLENYDNLITSKFKILIIDNKTSFINEITEKLKDYDVETFTNFSGLDAINKIQNGARYDLILLDDEMKQISGYEVFKKLKNIKKFKTPVIITLEKDKEFIKKHYINDGFSDYLLKSDIDNELKRIMDRFYFYK